MPNTKVRAYRDRILELLKGGPRDTTAINDHLGVPPHRRGGVFAELERLRKDGMVQKAFKRFTPAGTNKGWGQKERTIAVWTLSPV